MHIENYFFLEKVPKRYMHSPIQAKKVHSSGIEPEPLVTLSYAAPAELRTTISVQDLSSTLCSPQNIREHSRRFWKISYYRFKPRRGQT